MIEPGSDSSRKPLVPEVSAVALAEEHNMLVVFELARMYRG